MVELEWSVGAHDIAALSGSIVMIVMGFDDPMTRLARSQG